MTAGFLTSFVFRAVFWREPIPEQPISINKIAAITKDKVRPDVEIPLREINNV